MASTSLDRQRNELLERLEVLREQKDHAAAVAVAAEYTQVTEEAFGADSAEAAESLFTFAAACLASGQPVMAEQPLRRSLDLCQRHFGDRHPQTAARLYQLADALADTGRGGEAEVLFRQALAIAREVFGSDRRTAAILFALGRLLYARGQEGPAEALFDEMASIYSAVDGGNPMAMAEHIGDLGGFYASRGRHEQAEPLLRQRLEIDRRVFAANMPPDSPPRTRVLLLPSLDQLAEAYERLGQPDKAEPLVEELLTVFADLDPCMGDSPPLGEVRLRLARLYQQTGKAGRAVPLVEQALRVFRAHPEQPGRLREAVEILGELFLAAGDAPQAELLLEEALRLAREHQPDDGLTVALRLAYLAEATADAGRRSGHYEEAAGLLRAAAGPRSTRLPTACATRRPSTTDPAGRSPQPRAAGCWRPCAAGVRGQAPQPGRSARRSPTSTRSAASTPKAGCRSSTSSGTGAGAVSWCSSRRAPSCSRMMRRGSGSSRRPRRGSTSACTPASFSAYYARRLDGFPRVLIEKMDGGSLKTWLSQGKIRDLATALDIAVQVASGVAYAQRRRPGFVHRDLKPANVLMTPQGGAKVSDFGLVSAASGWLGTPAYMAPELWQDVPRVGPAADIYSFGVLLYELLAGRRPFDRGDAGASLGQLRGGAGPHGSLGALAAAPGGAAGASLGELPGQQRVTNASLGQLSGPLPWFREDDLSFYRTAHRDTPPPPLCPLNAAVSPRLEALCLGLLAKDPARRPSSMTDVVAELKEAFRETVGIPYFREEPAASELRGGNLNNYAVTLLDLGRREEAARHWEEALQAEPHHPETTYNRGLLRWRAGAITDEALLQQLAEVRASHGPDRSAHLVALAHFERGDCRQALAELPPEGTTEPPEVAAVRALIEPHRDHGPELLRSWDGHESAVSALALSSDGRRALSAGWDGTLKLWDLASGDCLRTFKADGRMVTAAAVSPDWRRAVAFGSEEGLRLGPGNGGVHKDVRRRHPGLRGRTLPQRRRLARARPRRGQFCQAVGGRNRPVPADVRRAQPARHLRPPVGRRPDRRLPGLDDDEALGRGRRPLPDVGDDRRRPGAPGAPADGQ